MQWFREDDVSPKFFHTIMSSRIRRNAIQFIMVDRELVEGVTRVRESVLSHFAAHFHSSHDNRPTMDDIQFRSVSCRQGACLIKPFSLDEVKVAVWDCDSYKCPCLDGSSFGFIKEFWDILKDDLMQFLVEFHRNGKLTKGINSTSSLLLFLRLIIHSF